MLSHGSHKTRSWSYILEKVGEVELVYGDEVTAIKNVFMHTVYACAAKINNTKMFNDIDNLTDSIELRARTIVNQVTYLKVVFGPPVKWHDHRESIGSIWKSFSLHFPVKI